MPLINPNKPLIEIGSFDLSAGGTTSSEVLNMPNYKFIYVQIIKVLGNAGSANTNIQFSDDNGASYDTSVQISPTAFGNYVNGLIVCSIGAAAMSIISNVQRGSASPITSNTLVTNTNFDFGTYPNAMKLTWSLACQASAGAAVKFWGILA